MARRSNRAARNLRTAGGNAAKLAGRATEKAAVGLFRWATTDHYGNGAILRKQLQSWDKIMAAKSAENPAFKKVLESMRTFAARAARWQNDTSVDYKMAYNHFFARKKG